jgi:hypothetical protein
MQMARSKLFTAEEILTVRTALAGEGVPEALKPPLKRYLKALQKSRSGRRDVLALLYPGKSILRGRYRKGHRKVA